MLLSIGMFLVAEQQAAIRRQDYLITRGTILHAFREVASGRVLAGQAISMLAETAARASDKPEKVALTRAAIADLAQIAESESTD